MYIKDKNKLNQVKETVPGIQVICTALTNENRETKQVF
jgi:hypothetical protein